MKTEWCKDIEWQLRCGDKNKGAWYMPNVESYMDCPLMVPKDWVSCPICKAERPKEARKLANVIYEKYKKSGIWHEVAEEAMQAFEEALDSLEQLPYSAKLYLKEAKKMVRERLI